MTLVKKSTAELIATFVLTFAGCGAIVVESLTGALGHTGVALTWGFVVLVMIYTFGHISGAHMNPAVTLAFRFQGEISTREALNYMGAQFLGAILASLALYVLFIEETGDVAHLAYLGTTLPRGSSMQSFVLEFILTMILMIVVYGSAVHARAVKSFAGMAIGLTVGLEALFAGPITGASMNPARSLGPALVSGHYEHLWIYLTATTLGAISGLLLMRWIEKG